MKANEVAEIAYQAGYTGKYSKYLPTTLGINEVFWKVWMDAWEEGEKDYNDCMIHEYMEDNRLMELYGKDANKTTI